MRIGTSSMIPLCVILVLVGGCMKNGKDVVTTDALKEDAGMASTAPTGAIDIPLLTTWPGDFPMARLALLPEGQRDSSVGYFGDEASFASAWSAFKPDEALPSVDFEESIVVFLRNTQFYNRIMMGKGILKDGVLEMIAAETMSARPIEDKAAMSMAVVPRAGVKSIQNGPQSIAVAPR